MPSNQVIRYNTEDELTRFALFYLFGCQRKGGEQLREYLDNHLSHGDCLRGLVIDIEATEEVFDRFQQIDQCIVAVNHALDRLIRWDVSMRA